MEGSPQNLKQLRAAWRGRWNQARRHAAHLMDCLKEDAEAYPSAEMKQLREILDELTQCVHEANAYRNAATTGFASTCALKAARAYQEILGETKNHGR